MPKVNGAIHQQPQQPAISYDEAFAQFGSTVFDDVLPEPIEVSIIEYQSAVVGKKADGTDIVRRKPVTRTAVIGTYVPMAILHKMLASQDRIRQIQAMAHAQASGGAVNAQEAMIEWMTEQVWAVWTLTEPDMTYEALMEGLSFQKVFGLFNVFFGDLLKNLNRPALTSRK